MYSSYHSSSSHAVYADSARAHTLTPSLYPGGPHYEEISRRPSYMQNEFGYFVANEARTDMRLALPTADLLSCNVGIADMFHENGILEDHVDLLPPDAYGRTPLANSAPTAPTKAAPKRASPRKAVGRPRSPTKASTKSPRKAAAPRLASVREYGEASEDFVVTRGRRVTHSRAEDELKATMSASTVARLSARAMQSEAMEGVVPSHIYSASAPPTMTHGSPTKPAPKRKAGTRSSPRKANKADFA